MISCRSVSFLSLILLLQVGPIVDAYGQSAKDRRAMYRAVREERDARGGGLLNRLFGERPSAATPAQQPGQEPVRPTSAQVEPLPPSPADPAIASEVAQVSPTPSGNAGEGKIPPQTSSQRVTDAINEVTRSVGSDPSGEASQVARDLLQGREAELQSLSQKLVEDPKTALKEGTKLLENPETRDLAARAMAQLRESNPNLPSLPVGDGALPDLSEIAGAAGADSETLSAGLEEMRKRWEKMDDEERSQIVAQMEEGGRRLSSETDPTPVPAPRSFSNDPLIPISSGAIPAPVDPVATPIPRGAISPAQVTRITAESARFDAKSNVVTFEENVELDHHEFDLACDILIAELMDSGEPTDSATATAKASAGGIRRAIAKGYVVIEKLSADGGVQVAKARHAVYDAQTGDVVLSDFPQLQDGKNLISGATQTTKIYLRQNGKYEVKGLADFEIVTGANSLEGLRR